MRTPIKIIFILAVGAFSFCYGRNVPFKDQWPLYEALRNTSAIIFGVMGAWLAIIYPDGIFKLFSPKEKSLKKEQLDIAKKLNPPIIYSTFIIAYVLAAGFIAPLLKHIPELLSYKAVLRGASYAILGMLTVLQLWALLWTLVSNFFLQKGVDFQIDSDKQKKQMFCRNQTRK